MTIENWSLRAVETYFNKFPDFIEEITFFIKMSKNIISINSLISGGFQLK